MRLLATVVLLSFTADGAPPLLTKTKLFEGGEGGYKLYRIPGIVVTRKGTILVYCEARRHSGGDWDTIDILLRRGTDGAQTFSPPESIAYVTGQIARNPVAIERKQGQPTDVTYNNPVAIADRDGTVHFLFCLEYMRVFYMRSRDDAKTFSAPVEITPAFDTFRPEFAWRVVATGPGHGIQLASGRLIVPVWLALGTTGNGHGPSVNATVYSDDRGATWHRGDLAIAADSPEFPSPNETAAVQLADGSVILNIRTLSPRNRRAIVTGKVGATAWSQPRFQPDLPGRRSFAAHSNLWRSWRWHEVAPGRAAVGRRSTQLSRPASYLLVIPSARKGSACRFFRARLDQHGISLVVRTPQSFWRLSGGSMGPCSDHPRQLDRLERRDVVHGAGSLHVRDVACAWIDGRE